MPGTGIPSVHSIAMRFILVLLLWSLAVTAAHAAEAPSKQPVASHPSPQAPAAVHSSAQKQAPAEDSDEMWVRLSRQATLRDGPSAHARILAEVDLGSEAKVMWRRRDGWVEIKLPASSLVGWTREKNLPPARSRSAVQGSGPANAARQTSETPQPAPRSHARMASGKRHHRAVASSHRNRGRFVAAPPWGNSNWRGAYAHFRTFGYRYY
jgi:hypothetical protein